MTKFSTLKSAALSAVIGLGLLTTAPTASSAMEVYNCTTDHLPVAVTHVPSGRQYQSVTLKPGDGVRWDTGRGDGFRVSINVIGPDKRFSGRNGGEIISIKTIAGNTELVHGKQCSKQSNATPKAKPSNSGGLDAKDALAIGVAGLILNELLKNQ